MMELDEGSKVVITSPNFPDTYSPNSQCDWQFKGAPGRRVGIKVVRLDTENKAVSCMYPVKTIELYRSTLSTPFHNWKATYLLLHNHVCEFFQSRNA